MADMSVDAPAAKPVAVGHEPLAEPNPKLAARIEARPRLGFWELWNMSFGKLGIQFGWGLQTANMSAIYTKLGADPANIPILGLAGPITGLIIQPIIGLMSDRTWHPRWGRRRPYFLAGAAVASIALALMPTSPSVWVAALLLWILDASANVSMEPFRALVADKLPLSQRAAGFLMQSFFVGLGSTLAYVTPFALHSFGRVTAEASNHVPMSVFYAFRIGAAVFFLAVLWTVIRTREDPPMDMDAFERHRRATRGLAAGARAIFDDIRTMPLTMRQLFWVQFMTWFGTSCAWGYFSLTVARNVFGAGTSKGALLDRANEWAGLCMALSSVICFVAAPLLPALSRRLGQPRFHAVALAVGGLGVICLALIHARLLLLPAIALYGVANASIIALPYAILSVALPPNRMGVYMGIFNFFIVIPQAGYSLLMPPVVKYVFHSDPALMVALGGVCLLIAAALSTRIVEVTPESAG